MFISVVVRKALQGIIGNNYFNEHWGHKLTGDN